MFKFFFNPQRFFSPEDIGDVADFSADMAVLNDETPPADKEDKTEAEQEAEDVEKDIKVLADDDSEEPAGEDDEGGEEDGEQEDEETQEEGEGQEEVPVTGGRPSIGAVKKEFPDIFKKFPTLKASIFRDEKFSESFANPEEAAEAAVKADNYDQLEQSLVSGSPELLMKELHDNNPRAFEKVAENWLPQLRAIDEKAYIAATEPIIEELVYLAFKHGTKVQDKNLIMSARHIANFVFANGGEIPDIGEKKSKAPNPAEVQLQREREQWAQTRFKEADQEIFGRVTRSLDQVIRQGLDPAGSMTERMKSSIVKDVINEINKVLVQDGVHGRRMQALWKRASNDSYSKQSKESIVNTYLSGAKPLLREIRNRIRAEYLGSPNKKRLGDDKDERLSRQPQPQKKRAFEGSSRRVDVRRERVTVLDPKKIDYSRTSDMDILEGRATAKGQK